MTSETPVLENPFPGLRPFREDEEYLFFGRESQVDRMIDKLAATHFLAVVGTSGTGKSSLVNCGLKPALHRGLMSSAGTSWRMVQFRPGGNPIRSMAQAFADAGFFVEQIMPEGLSARAIAETTLRMSSLGLVDIFDFAHLEPGTNLLLVVDQFEELFRYGKAARGPSSTDAMGGDATTFVNLLLEPLSHPSYPIYIVLTMRSDFLGECSQFDRLPEVMNDSQYLVPRLTRDERRAAIAEPIAVAGGDLSAVLLTRLVNDVGETPDQLSILQHAVNRTWAHWQDEGSQGVLAVEDYEAVGTMARALDEHADEAYNDLETPGQKKLCEKVFKALTDRGTDARGIRRPMQFQVLCEVVGAAPDELAPVLEVFRVTSRSFLMPPSGEPLEKDTVIDISHEILMRVWERLRRWSDEEAQSAITYRRLAETADLYETGREGLLRDPGLKTALTWQWSEQPTAAWAALYRPGFESALSFLEASKEALDKERTEIAFQRKWRGLTPFLGIFAFLIFLLVSPWISELLAPLVRPRVEKTLVMLHMWTPSQRVNPWLAAKAQKNANAMASQVPAANAAPAANPPPLAPDIASIAKVYIHEDLPSRVTNALDFGVAAILCVLLYGFIWWGGRKAYRSLAFAGIARQVSAMPRAPDEMRAPRVHRVAAAKTSGEAAQAPNIVDAVYASFGRRLSAGIVDFFVFLFVGAIAGFIAIIADVAFSFSSQANTGVYLFLIVWLILDCLYQLLTGISEFRGTLGDLAAGIAVTDRKGRRIHFKRIALRYGISALPLIFFYIIMILFGTKSEYNTLVGGSFIICVLISILGFLIQPFTPGKRSLTDLLAGTLVLRRPKKELVPVDFREK
jgi:uncharacterized RDD family membrane protein YckC